MSGAELFLVIFGAVLTTAGVVVFSALSWFKGGGAEHNAIKILQAEFRLSHPALVIFVGGIFLMVIPFLVDLSANGALETPDVAPSPTAFPARAPSSATNQGLVQPSTLEISTPAPPSKSEAPKANDPVATAAPGVPEWELKVEPEVSRHAVGRDHTVIVTLWDLDGTPVEGGAVLLEISDGPHAGIKMGVRTDSAGQGFFSYPGKSVGTDIIRVWAGTNKFEDAPRGMGFRVTNEWF